MPSLLSVACSVQAAVKAYNSVKEYADQELWGKQFEKEKARTILAFQQAKADHQTNKDPDLHPILAALPVVLSNKEDFSLITPNHPQLHRHKYYNPSAVFPDLDPFLPPREDCWWEDLVAQSLQRRALMEAGSSNAPTAPEESAMAPEEPAEPAVPDEQTTAEESVASAGLVGQPIRKIRLLLPKPPSQPAEDEGKEMEVDELPKRRQKRKAAEAAAPAKSRKRSAPAFPSQAQATERPDDALPRIQFQCDRCVNKRIPCKTNPTGPCNRCRADKVRCSLMPQNVETGKTNRQQLSEADIYKFRLQEHNKKKAKESGQKGKEPVHRPQEELQPDASGSGPSPSSTLAPLVHGMTLGSGSSPADSPSSEPPSANSPKPPSFLIEMPVTHYRQRRQPSPTALSQSSDDGHNIAARLAALEAKVDRIEAFQKEIRKKFEEVDRKFRDIDHKFTEGRL